MSKNVVLLAETGSDIPPALANRYGIYLVPMHVSFDDQTKDDGTFPPEDVCNYFNRTGRVPKTSGCTPEDFQKVFDQIKREHPGKLILHLAYSAVTTCSYQSAIIAADGADNIVSLDTKQVSAGQAAIILTLARMMEQDPELSADAVITAAQELCRRARMSFLPDKLEYLRAGGRVSNVACLGGRILHIHPQIELQNGYLVAEKKYRGDLKKVVDQMICDYAEKRNLSRGRLWLLYSVGLPKDVRDTAEETAERIGFRKFDWLQTGCVITTHGGPGCFGLAGFSEE